MTDLHPAACATPVPDAASAAVLSAAPEPQALLTWPHRYNCTREQNKESCQANPHEESAILQKTRDWRIRRAEGLFAVNDTWHTQRALGLLGRERTVRECGTQAIAVGFCRDCGKAHVHPRRCGDRHVCGACAARAGRKTWARSQLAVARMVREARAEWQARGRVRGQRPIVRMLTLTTRDTGDLVADRDLLQRAWARHRAWLDRQANPSVARKMGLPRAKVRFVRVWQVTPGTHGLGHVHCHIVTVLGWYDYGDARKAWIRETGGESTQYDVSTSTTTDAKQASNAARYLARYISHGDDELDDELGAAWWIASYGRRALSAHRGAWYAREPAHCQDCGSLALSWVPARGDLERVTQEATGPPVPWATLTEIPLYALADLAGYVGPA